MRLVGVAKTRMQGLNLLSGERPDGSGIDVIRATHVRWLDCSGCRKSLADDVLVMAALAGVTSNAISIASPVPPLSIAFCFFELLIVTAKLWHMDALAYKAPALIVMLYVAILIAEASRVAVATRPIIGLRFELEESHRQRREIEQREILNNERQRLMRDMHDGLGTSLAGALRAAKHGHITAAMLAPILRDCIDDLKISIDSTEPVETDLLLQLATLRYRLNARLKSCGITLYWEVKPITKIAWLTLEKSMQVLRILQEAFGNIVKHAKATEIHVSTQVEDEFVLVKIRDNGVGFNPPDISQNGGRGLINQLRRAAQNNARITGESNEQGCCFVLRIPFKLVT